MKIVGMPLRRQLARCEQTASVNMADNVNDDLRRRLEAQEQTFKTKQEALDNIQQMLAQLFSNRNNNDAGSNHDEEEHLAMSSQRRRNPKRVLP